MFECRTCLLRCFRAIAGDVLPPAGSSSRAGMKRIRHGTTRAYSTDPGSQRYTPMGREPRSYPSASSASSEGRPTRDRGEGRSYPRSSEGSEDRSYPGAPVRSRDRYTPAGSETRSYPSTSASREVKNVKFGERYDFQRREKRNPTDRLETEKDWFISLNRRRRVELPSKAYTEGDEKDSSSRYALSPEMERAVKKELEWLGDPLKHANHVKQTLRQTDLDKALALCRIASRNMQVIVSWNHIIDYLLARRELKMALKIYNEMKKRAQFPDSHTYVILLRGLSTPPVHAETVGQALSIYHSLAAPNSKVQQGIMHTNAALKVCARAHDMDSMWGIASHIPEKGHGAADNLTYTTIINAIRETALLQSGPRDDDAAVYQTRQTAIKEGRRIWGDIVMKWRKGDVVVDEELVCAMGRLLLIGLRPRDWDDVLSLVEQTMNIPRLTPKLGTVARKAELEQSGKTPRVLYEDAKVNDDEEEIMSEFDKDLVRTPSRKVGGGSGGSVLYVRPGNNTLSLLMEACLKSSVKTAYKYWDLLTPADTYDVKPDMDNLNSLLRILRSSRDSDRTVEVLKTEVLGRRIEPMRKTFRIAMSACKRDGNNPNAARNAGAIMDMMEANSSVMDVQAAQMFLEISLTTEDGKQIAHAINRLGPVVKNIRSQLTYGSDAGAAVSRAIKDEADLLFRSIIGAIDLLMNRKLVPREEFVAWTQRRSRLASHVTRLQSKVSGHGYLDDEKLKEFRKESRQLRNFRRNSLRRAKQASGTWSDEKKVERRADERADERRIDERVDEKRTDERRFNEKRTDGRRSDERRNTDRRKTERSSSSDSPYELPDFR